jgi:competence protein ComEC
MKKLLEYLPFHFTLFLIIGIASQFNVRIWSFGFSRIAFTILFLFLLLVFLKKSTFFFLCVWSFFFFLGIALVYIQDDRNYPSYYEYHYSQEPTIVIAVEKVLKPSRFYHKYEVGIIQVDSVRTRGKVLLNIHRDSTSSRLEVDDVLLLKVPIETIAPPLNPHQFNYKNYLKKQGIHHQVFIHKGGYVLKKDWKRFSLRGLAANIRNKLIQTLKQYDFKDDELSIISALLLGQRQEISKELLEDYTRAGAIHILAVSGLHVGILLLILSYVLKPIERVKRGKLLKAISIIILLWFFALIAGLSASVVRAVTMFTFVAIAMVNNRENSVLYSLVASVFFLLLVKPLFLFDVGFQLSYLAVFGIVWIQPKLYKIWKPKVKFVNKIWQLFTVSIAAQFGVLPISLYYFHQFPGLFLASNLIIVPFLGIILVGGIIVIILALVNVLPDFLTRFYGWIISLMNDFIHYISAQERFLITDISFSGLLMFISYLILFSFVSLAIRKSYRTALLFLASIIMLHGILFYEKYEKKQKEELIIFHKNRSTLLAMRRQDSIEVFHNLKRKDILTSNIIRSYKVEEQVGVKYRDEVPNFFHLDTSVIVIINQKAIYNFKGIKHPIIILRASPKINLQRVLEKLEPSYIIADGSNYRSSVVQWQQTCVKNKTPFWYTGQNGAYIIKE